MSKYIAIDCGTTNTRISLVTDYKIIQTLKFNVGARKGIDNKSILRETIKKGIEDVLTNNALTKNEITCILLCGMITSEFGLCELEHLTVPVTIEELNVSIEECTFADIIDIPFKFIRGVKMKCETIEDADMMRGEESEVMGILKGEGVYVLPGSHSKIINVDEKGRIANLKTMLTGEMISAIINGTILKDAVILDDFPINSDYLKMGMEYAKNHGINEALFKVRVLKNIFRKNECEIYNFYLGILLSEEVNYILSQKSSRIVIGGKKAIKEALSILLKEFSDAEVITLSDDEVDSSSVFGMIKILELQNFKYIGKEA